METLRFESHRAPPSVMTHPQLHHQAPADSTPRHLPQGAAELMLPAAEAILRVRNLAEFLIIPLAARMHAVSRHLVAVVVPAMAALLAAAYQSLLVSAAAVRLAAVMSRAVLGVAMGVLWYVSAFAATKNFQKKLEQELYSFFLGPGNALMKMAFWLGWWSVLGAFISWPWWFLTT